MLPNSLSVIIPTYNRSDVIAKALEGYRAQSPPALIQELLVVDDGSTDDTESVVRQFSATAPFQVRYLRQPNQGPAAARNLGIRQARSNLLLFTDSDIIPERELVAQHIEWHKRNPEIGTAVLGYVTWSPAVEPTPFMRWYGESSGRLFAFDRLQAGKKVSFRYFFTCNLSLKRDFLLTYGQFDEDFKGAAFEDVDLGYRLSKHGLQIFYNPAAIGYHYQFFSFEAACRKERGKDPAARVFFQKESGRLITGETEGKRDRTKYAAARSAAKKVAVALTRALAPVRPWLDSKVPLPSFVYKLFLWYDLNHRYMVVDRKGHSSNRA
jgi:glycosyltransferase involved in cell wall biosynthesis